MYLDNNIEYNKHVGTLKHKNNVQLKSGEIIKNEDKVECVTCNTTLSQYSVDKYFQTKTNLDNVEGITKDKIPKEPRSGYTNLKRSFTDSSSYCGICNTSYDNKNKHNDTDEHKENDKQRKLTDGKSRDKINELGIDHNMKYNQIMTSRSDYEDTRFSEALEALYYIHPHIKFNTFDVVSYTKPTDEQLEENEFTFRLMTRQYNGSYDLDLLNGELKSRMQEQEMNQSGWSTKRFVKRTIYILRYYPTGGYTTTFLWI